MSNTNDKISTGLTVASILLVVPSLLWSAYVVATLWGWFLVPLGVMSITMAHAMGLDVIITYLTGQGAIMMLLRGLSGESADEKAIEGIVIALVTPALALLMGYVALCFM